MKRKKVVLITAITLVLAVAGVFLYLSGKKDAQISLVTVQPEKGHIATIVTSTGTLQPVDTVAVGTQISGIISKIYTDYNAEVKEGQLLAELDPTLMQASVDQIEGSLSQAISNLDYQTANFNRQEELYGVGAISRASYEVALNSYQVAKANVASIQAQLKAARQNLEFTKIYSPITGVVLNRSVSAGQTVAASFNTPTLFSLAKDITKMQVQAKVDEADIGEIVSGQRVTFTVDAFINEVFEGTVSEVRLQPTTSSNVVTYTTIINAANDDMKLMPGMTATITIYTKESTGNMLIPVNAIKYTPDPQVLGTDYQIVDNPHSGGVSPSAPGDGDTAEVWVAQGYQLIKRIITTGINDNTKVEVLSGLSPEDKVITGTTTVTQTAPDDSGAGGSPFMPQPPRRR